MKKRLSNILWYGSDVDSYGSPIIPSAGDGLEGLHHGELFLHLSEGKVTMWTLSANGNVIEVGGTSGIDLSAYLLKSVWDKAFEVRKDIGGSEYIFSKLPLATQYGITMYADGGDMDIPSIYDGLPIDNSTLYWEEIKDAEGNVTGRMLKAAGGGGLDEEELKTFLTNENYAKKTDIPSLNGYATESWVTGKNYVNTTTLSSELAKYIPISGDTDILGLKNFTKGLQIDGLGITKSQEDVVYIDANLVVRGGITMYGIDSVDVPTIMDAIATDNVNLKVVDGVLTFVGSSGGLSEVYWDDVIGRPTLLSSFIDDVVDGHYLPLSGGQMTGNIGYTLEKGGNIPFAGSFNYNSLDDFVTKKSFIGNGQNTTKGHWFHLISVRADNGNDNYGMYIGCSMTDYNGSLFWNRQEGYEGAWQGERIILDSVNWSQYISAGQVGAYLPQSGGNMSGHIFMTGAVENSSTANTTQLVFGTSAKNHVCLTSNMKGLIINPSLTDTSGQIALYADVDRESFIRSSLKVYGSLYASVYFNYGGSIAQSYGSSMYVWDNNLQINKTTSGNGYLKTIMSFDLINENIALNINGKLSFNSYVFWNSNIDNPYMGITHGGYTWYLQAYNNNYIYLGAGSAKSMRVDASGNILTPGGITMYSDIRKKTKLQDVELTLQQIADAPLIEHYYNSDEKRITHVGSIAQYWASMNDWFCKLDNEGYYTMEIQNAALASAISIARELQRYESKTDKKIRLLKKRIGELEDKIEELEKKGA